VEYDERLIDKSDCVGATRYRENKVLLQNPGPNIKGNLDNKEETYLHEIVHWILYMMHENQLNDNEKFVGIKNEN
jgi:hypothetical protein